ncbi:MAG: outer membrane beta-barrel protein [bacterium]
MKRYWAMLACLTFSTFAVTSAFSAESETREELRTKYPWNISLGGGWKDFEGDEVVADSPFVSCQLEYDYPSRWTFMGVLAYYPKIDGNMGNDWTAGGQEYNRLRKEAGVDSTKALSLSVEGLYHFSPNSERRLDPYLVASAGVMHYFDEFADVNSWDPNVTAGAGLLYNISRQWAVRADARALVTFSDGTQANSFFTFGAVYKLTL